MIETRFAVLLQGRRIGTLRARGQASQFSFSDQYVQDPERQILGLRFEDDPRKTWSGFRELPPWFSNLLPEGRLRRFLIGSGRSGEVEDSLAVELELLRALGADLPGSVQCIEEPVDADDSLGEDLLAGIRPTPAASAAPLEDARFRFSMAGVGLKVSMSVVNERFVVPAVGEDGRWIVKFPDPLFPALPANEFAMMTVARAVGIQVPEFVLVERGRVAGVPDLFWGTEEHAYAVRRFDRAANGRVHIEDFAQVRGFPPRRRYDGTFETLAALVYRNRDDAQLIEFTRRLAFNIIIGNSDAHLKNWSLIYTDPQQPVLSPAYDLNSVVLYPPTLVTQDLGLRFARSREYNDVDLASFERLQRKLETTIDLPDVVRALAQTVPGPLAEQIEILRGKGIDSSRLESHSARLVSRLSN